MAAAAALTQQLAAAAAGPPGWVYLLHFDVPFRHALHYTGWTAQLGPRLDLHARGGGARLLAHARAAGVTWQLARLWWGDRWLERRLKRQGGASRRCPVCHPPRRGLRRPHRPVSPGFAAVLDGLRIHD